MPVSDYAPIFQAAGQEWNVDPTHLMAIADQESGGNPKSVSSKGAAGVMQIMPGTGQELGVTDPTDPTQSIYAGAKYYRQMLDKYGNAPMALAAYNAGPGRVDDFKAGRQDLPTETKAYVPDVAALIDKYRKAQAAPSAPATPKSDAAPTMSDEEFLKATTGSPAQANPAPNGLPSDDDFLAATGGVKAAAPPPPSAPPQLNADMAVGDTTGATNLAAPAAPSEIDPRAAGDTTGATNITGANAGTIPAPIQAVANAAVQGFGPGPLGLTPEQSSALQPVNRLIVAPLVAAGDLALRTGGAIFRGGQEAVQQVGNALGAPGLGRDIAAMPEAFMGSPGGLGMPRVPAPDAIAPVAEGVANRLAIGAAPLSPEFMANPLTASARATADAIPQVPGAPASPTGLSSGALPVPDSVGAAATPGALAEMPRGEMIAQRATAERAKLNEPQPAGPDSADYVPSVNPTEAQMVQNARTSRNEKLIASEMPQGFQDRARENNDARLNYFDDLSGTPTLQRRLQENLDAQASGQLQQLWENKQPTDPAPVMQTAQDILASADGRRPAVRNAVQSVTNELTDASGQPITDPEILYGVRKHINDLLSPQGAKDNPLSTRVTAQLSQLKDSLDNVIEAGAPGFQQYLSDYSEAAKPIEEMSVLQDYKPKIVDSQNRMTYSGVQRMMRDLVTDREAPGINPAQSISDDTMNSLWNLRDDLRRVASADDMARARGSDTVQNALDLMKHAAASGGTALLHAGANYLAPGVGSLGVNLLTNKLRTNALQKGAARALNPDRNRLVSPDAP